MSDELLCAPVWIEPDLEAIEAIRQWMDRRRERAYAGMPRLANDGSGSLIVAKVENISGRPLTFAKK